MRLGQLILGTLAAIAAQGATLERLSLDDMIQKSTTIVRGRVLSSRPLSRGSMIYTASRVAVAEQWKGAPATELEVVVPGGVSGRQSMSFSGSPRLTAGDEMVFFLWTGRNGLNQVIGLSQGLFSIRANAKGDDLVNRPAASAEMIDSATGRRVEDSPVTMRLSDLRQRVRQTLGEGVTR